jgi:Tol biopolymer transport system component
MPRKFTFSKVLHIGLLVMGVLLVSCESDATTPVVTEPVNAAQDPIPLIDQTVTPVKEIASTANAEEQEVYTSPTTPNSSGEYPSPTCVSIAASANQIVAFVSDRRDKDRLDIWVIDVESGEQAAVTSTASQDWHPLWSPDGQKLAYLSAENQEDIFLVVVEFSACETISRLRVPDIVSFSWSADGASLWLDTRSGLSQYDFFDGAVTQHPENVRSATEAPNRMFFAMRLQRDPELYYYDLLIHDQENNILPIQFVSELPAESVYDIAWAHRASRLAVTFLPARQQHTGGISLLAYLDGTFEEVASLQGQEPSLDYCYPAWSPTDLFISYVVAWHYAQDPCSGDVYVAGDELQQIFHISDKATITQQPWSPAGTQIAFSQNARSPWYPPSRSYGFPGEGSIWVSDFDGSNQRLLTESDWYDGEAVWRP